MSRNPGDGTGTYIHPTTLTEEHAIRLGKRALRDQQSHAFVNEKGRFQAWCPIEDEERFKALIEDTRDL